MTEVDYDAPEFRDKLRRAAHDWALAVRERRLRRIRLSIAVLTAVGVLSLIGNIIVEVTR